MSNITVLDLVEAIDASTDNPASYNVSDYFDFNIQINTRDGEIPVLSVYMDADGKTIHIDAGEDRDD